MPKATAIKFFPDTKICIATPTHGQIFYAPYVSSLFDLLRTFEQKKWASVFASCAYADVATSRNYLLTRWFDQTDATHLLFIDADMGFNPKLIADMVALNKPVVGVIYTKRQIDLERLIELVKKGEAANAAIAKAHDFIVRLIPGRIPLDFKGFMEVAGCGAGILLIQRAAIATMLKKIPEIASRGVQRHFPDARNLKRIICAFDPIEVEGALLSEDYSFCYRWRDICSGEIWASFDQSVVHIGLHEFSSRYSDANQTGPRILIKKS